MFAHVFSCAVLGLDGVIVEVEVEYTNAMPSMTIVGLPDAAVQESRGRVQTAVKNAGLHYPRHRIVVNLAAASVRKEGPACDVPIALGVIVLGDHLPHDVTEGTLVVGELSLDGNVRLARWVLPMAATARAQGFKRIVVPEADAAEAALIPSLTGTSGVYSESTRPMRITNTAVCRRVFISNSFNGKRPFRFLDHSAAALKPTAAHSLRAGSHGDSCIC